MMRVLGFIFLAICLIGLGIAAVKLGWVDAVINWFMGLVK